MDEVAQQFADILDKEPTETLELDDQDVSFLCIQVYSLCFKCSNS